MICEAIDIHNPVRVKRCTQCAQIKPHDEFYYINKKKKFKSECIICNKKRGKETRQKYKNQEKILPVTKICLDCGVEKSSLEFVKLISNKDGLTGYCKPCKKIRSLKYSKEVKNINKTSPDSKICRRCNQLKKSDEFSTNKYSLDGLKPYCRPCECRKSVDWASKNLDTVSARQNRRRARKLNAMPKWLTNEHHKIIKEIYAKCRETTKITGIPHEVDHIHPLSGSNFSGLHVPWNLQIITESENCSKNNNFPKGEEHLFWQVDKPSVNA
jgi:hypothetical protein